MKWGKLDSGYPLFQRRRKEKHSSIISRNSLLSSQHCHTAHMHTYTPLPELPAVLPWAIQMWGPCGGRVEAYISVVGYICLWQHMSLFKTFILILPSYSLFKHGLHYMISFDHFPGKRNLKKNICLKL